MLAVSRAAYRDHISSALTVALNRSGNRRRVIRHYLFRALRPVARSIEFESRGIHYFIDPNDTGVSLAVFTDGSFDEVRMNDIVALLESETGRSLTGRTFIDIGANIGTTTALALKNHGVARVVAFEPVARNFELLRHLVIANGFDEQVECHQVALSDHDGTATMELSAENMGDHRVRHSVTAGLLGEERWHTAAVRTARFDSLSLDLTDVAAVWMDVQGHEGHVLQGASDLLKSSVPVVVEYHPYMLARAGGLDLFHRLVASHFETVVDMTVGDRLSAGSVADLASRYIAPTYTDLVLLR